MKIRKLDKRYNGVDHWTHRAEPGVWRGYDARKKGLKDFFDQRVFLTHQFGPGCFVQEAWTLKSAGIAVPVWGFDGDGNIFLRDDAYTMFALAIERWK